MKIWIYNSIYADKTLIYKYIAPLYIDKHQYMNIKLHYIKIKHLYIDIYPPYTNIKEQDMDTQLHYM